MSINDLMQYSDNTIQYLLLRFDEYKQELERKYNTEKNKAKKNYDTIISYVLIFLFFYYLKDFLFYLLRKFDKLLIYGW